MQDYSCLVHPAGIVSFRPDRVTFFRRSYCYDFKKVPCLNKS